VRRLGDAVRDGVLSPFVHHWVTARVVGEENLTNLTSPALFIFNHCDDFDVPVLYGALPRAVRRRLSIATGSNIIDEHAVLAFIVRFCYAGFSFARNTPARASLTYVGELLSSGRHVAIAPEGELSPNGELADFKGGIGLLAVTLGVPVIPVRIDGLFGTVPLHAKWPKKKSRVTVRVGEAMTFARSERYRSATNQLRDAMLAL
jgi:1-acyl-sn-glycerol-3-phosphate acyltransferase